MNNVVDFFRFNKLCGFAVLLVAYVLFVFLAAFSGFWIGLSSIFLLYFLLCIYVFNSLAPKRWETSAVFILYLAASVLLIMAFAGVSLFNNYLFGIPKHDDFALAFWRHFYFSASMFTSLGFSKYQPVTSEAQVFAIAQSLLGSAHSVTFISVILMHSSWREQPERPLFPGMDSTLKKQLKLIEQIPQLTFMLRFVVGLLLLIFLVLLLLVFK